MTLKKEDWKPTFLNKYAESGNVRESAEHSGVTKQAVYKALKKNKAFSAEFQQARKELADELEAEGVSRAKDSSDTMLIFMLKGLKPDTYADRKVHGFDPDAPLKVTLKWE